MDIAEIVVLAASCLMVLFGLIAALLAFISPQSLERPWVRWTLMGSRITPTRANCMFYALCSVFLAAAMALSTEGHLLAALAALAVWASAMFGWYRHRAKPD